MLDPILIFSVPVAAIVRLAFSRYHSFYLFYIGLLYIYAVSPFVLYLIKHLQYDIFCQRYCVFDLDDIRFGFSLISLMLLLLIVVEFIIYRKPFPVKKEMVKIERSYFGGNLVYLYCIIFIVNIGGIFLYGMSNFFNSYIDPASNKIGSPAWSVMTNSLILLTVLYGYIGSRSTFLNLSFLFLLGFYLVGGARLVPVMSLLYVLSLWYGPVIKMKFKILLGAILFTISFILIGAFRSWQDGSFAFANGFLEFGFVTIGFYNSIAIMDLFQFNLYEFFVASFRIVPGLPFSGAEEVQLLKELYGDEKIFSPIGGSFALASLFIYFGVFAFIFLFFLLTLFMVFDYNVNVRFCNNPSVKNKILKSLACFLGVFALINLARNNYYSFVSISIKGFIIHFFLLFNFRIFK